MTTEVASKVIFFFLLACFLAIRGYFGWKAKQAGLSPTFEDESQPERQGGGPRLPAIMIPLLLLALLVRYPPGMPRRAGRRGSCELLIGIS